MGKNKILTSGFTTYWNIYNGVSGKVQMKNGGNTAHGNPLNSTSIGCYMCHNQVVSEAKNDNNYRCAVCHLTGQYGAQPKGKAEIANLSLHVNGARNVDFNPVKVITKAQIRPDSFRFYSGVWQRPNGYKNMTTLAFDVAKNALDTSSMWHPSTPMNSNCSNVACHNGKTVSWNMANWNDPNKCMDCHNQL